MPEVNLVHFLLRELDLESSLRLVLGPLYLDPVNCKLNSGGQLLGFAIVNSATHRISMQGKQSARHGTTQERTRWSIDGLSVDHACKNRRIELEGPLQIDNDVSKPKTLAGEASVSAG